MVPDVNLMEVARFCLALLALTVGLCASGAIAVMFKAGRGE